MDQFTRTVNFLSKQFDPTMNNGVGEWIEKEIVKTITFKDLIRTDATQHRLHFLIVSLISAAADRIQPGDSLRLGSNELYDLTTMFVKEMTVITEDFTEQNRTEFLLDSAALIELGLWLLGNKLAPFFSVLTKNLQQ